MSEKTYLRSHDRSVRLKKDVHEGTKYPCSKCDYQAKDRKLLWSHMKLVHDGVRYPCSKCDYQATRKDNLKTHTESVHEGKKFPCSMCNYQSTDISSLYRHKKFVHHGFKYRCSNCNSKQVCLTLGWSSVVFALCLLLKNQLEKLEAAKTASLVCISLT